jgi:glycerol kinase
VQIELIYPEAGQVEIDADRLYESVVKTVSDAIKGKFEIKSLKNVNSLPW